MLKNKTLASLAVLISGTALSQIIVIIASPFITRLYSPDIFGVLGSMVAISSLFSVVSSLKYEQSFVLEKSQRRFENLYSISIYLIVGVTSLLVVSEYVVKYLYSSENIHQSLLFIEKYPIFSVPLLVFFMSLFSVQKCVYNRLAAYGSISLMTITQRFTLVLLQIVFGVLFGGVSALITSQVLSYTVPSIFSLLKSKTYKFLRFRPLELKLASIKYNNFPKFSAPQNFLNTLSNQLPVFLLGSFFSLEVVGAYWFAMKIIQIPASLLGQAIHRVFYRDAANANNDRSLLQMYKKYVFYLSILILLPLFVVFFYGQEIFSIVFGEVWGQAGTFASWMMIWVAVAFINPPSIALFNVKGQQKIFAIYDLLLLLARITALLFGVFFLTGPIETIISYSLVGAVFNLGLVAYWFVYLKRGEIKIL